MDKKIVPKSTLSRYPSYLKALRDLESKGIETVMSSELAGYVSIPSTTIRRDFSFIGSLGKQGYGYNVSELVRVFNDVLGGKLNEEIIIVGFGNLGRALLNYNKWNFAVGKIVCGFDLKESNDFSIPIYDIKDLKEKKPKGCHLAIVTVSTDAQETVDKLVDAGITSIVDFTHQHLVVPSNIKVKTVDIVSLIQEMVFNLDVMNDDSL